MSVPAQARRVAHLLQQRGVKVVFAESCTGGLVSGALTRVPGISNHHCGCMVVYRSQTKAAWLGVPEKDLQRPGPVSRLVTARLAEEILKRTPEADVSLAVTGHLGPGAPQRLDGVIFVQIALRRSSGSIEQVASIRTRYPAAMNRVQRQRRAVQDALRLLADVLDTADVFDASR